MSWTSKIVWSEGMFLRPQHFQQNDRYFESLIENRSASLTPYSWGIESLELNAEALKLGKVEIAKCRAILPDGTTINIPSADAPPPPIEPHGNTKNENVYLCLLGRRPNATEASRDEDDVMEMRYGIEAADVRDSSLPEDSSAPVELARKNLLLLKESDERADFACVQIGRIIEVRSDKQLVMDDTFIPPSIDCRNNQRLKEYIESILARLNTRAEEVAGRLDGQGGGVAQVEDYMLLQLINGYEPVFRHFQTLPCFHPEALFRVCLQLAGELSTFLNKTHRPPGLPEYVHTDLTASFISLMSQLDDLLGRMREHSAQQIPLKLYKKWGINLAVVNDKTLFENAVWVLAAKADLPSEQLRNMFPQQATIGPKEMMADLITSQLQGITLEALSVAPRQIPFHAGFSYFELDRRGDMWKKLSGSGGIGLHTSGKYPGLELELWAIRG